MLAWILSYFSGFVGGLLLARWVISWKREQWRRASRLLEQANEVNDNLRLTLQHERRMRRIESKKLMPLESLNYFESKAPQLSYWTQTQQKQRER